MTWPGEAVELDWIDGLSDFGAGTRYLDGDATTITASDDFTVGFYDYQYVTGSDDAVFAVAFESLSGSASVAVSWGFDPTWSLDPAYATNSAGTHTVSAGISAVSLSGVSLAQYLASDDELIIRVQVLSGSIDVDQIRLRIWPPGGPIGGWSEVQTPTAVESVKVSNWSGIRWDGEDPVDGDQGVARAQAASVTPSSASGGVSSSSTTTRIDHWPNTYFDGYTSSLGFGSTGMRGMSFSFGGSSIPDPVPDGTEGVDWFRHPDSTEAEVQLVGDPSGSWVQPYATILARGLTFVGSDWISNDGPWWVRMESGAAPERPATSGYGVPYATPSGSAGDIPHPVLDIVSVPDLVGGVTVTLTGDGLYSEQGVVFTVGSESHSGGTEVLFILGIIDTPTVNQSSWAPGMDFTGYQPLEYAYTRAPYRYWSPDVTAIPVPTRVYPRADGLGMGAPRLMDNRSPYRSARVFGQI